MTYDIYRYVFYGGAALAVLSLITAVVLFFVLRIPDVIGDLTGVSARKAIENIRSQNERSGEKTYKSSAVNQERGKVTDRISASGKLIKASPEAAGGAMATAKIGTQRLAEEAQQSYETSLLENPAANETTVLTIDRSGETTVLDQAAGMAESTEDVFAVEYEISFIHTDETIE